MRVSRLERNRERDRGQVRLTRGVRGAPGREHGLVVQKVDLGLVVAREDRPDERRASGAVRDERLRRLVLRMSLEEHDDVPVLVSEVDIEGLEEVVRYTRRHRHDRDMPKTPPWATVPRRLPRCPRTDAVYTVANEADAGARLAEEVH